VEKLKLNDLEIQFCNDLIVFERRKIKIYLSLVLLFILTVTPMFFMALLAVKQLSSIFIYLLLLLLFIYHCYYLLKQYKWLMSFKNFTIHLSNKKIVFYDQTNVKFSDLKFVINKKFIVTETSGLPFNSYSLSIAYIKDNFDFILKVDKDITSRKKLIKLMKLIAKYGLKYERKKE